MEQRVPGLFCVLNESTMEVPTINKKQGITWTEDGKLETKGNKPVKVNMTSPSVQIYPYKVGQANAIPW